MLFGGSLKNQITEKSDLQYLQNTLQKKIIIIKKNIYIHIYIYIYIYIYMCVCVFIRADKM